MAVLPLYAYARDLHILNAFSAPSACNPVNCSDLPDINLINLYASGNQILLFYRLLAPR